MGYIFKFILFVIVFSWILKVARRLLFGIFYKRKFNQYNKQYNDQQQQPPHQDKKTPETQEERILDFQRKKFESTDIEDADYEEVK